MEAEVRDEDFASEKIRLFTAVIPMTYSKSMESPFVDRVAIA
jgi:hypothetical protein